MFRWTEASVEEMAQHIAVCRSQEVYSVIKYHTKHGNTDLVEKVRLARTIAKAYRKIAKARRVLEEYQQGV